MFAQNPPEPRRIEQGESPPGSPLSFPAPTDPGSAAGPRPRKPPKADALRRRPSGSPQLLHAGSLPAQDADALIKDYRRLIELTKPETVPYPQREVVPYPEREVVMATRRPIRHASDVPVLLSATEAKPHWLLTHNTRHFTKAVAARTGLRIATPVEFFETLGALFE